MNKKDTIVIAGSGMAEGGRVIHHLYNGLQNGKNSVAFVGYQAEKTLGRELVEGKKAVNVMEKLVNVKSEIYYLKGFSAHADKNDLKIWLKRLTTDNLKTVFLIHAESQPLNDYAIDLKENGYNVEIPELNQEYIL